MSRASRSSRFGGSSRSGRELISTAVPYSRQAVKTSSASNSDSGLPFPTTRRPVQWPRMSTWGLATATAIRRVMAARSIRSLEWRLATTTSSRASSSSSWSSDPSSAMSTSIPVRMRNGAISSLRAATTSSCSRSRSAERPLATVRRGEWSVSTMYSWPRSRAALAISSMGEPPSDQVEWVWQSPLRAWRSSAAGPLRTGWRAQRRANASMSSPPSSSAASASSSVSRAARSTSSAIPGVVLTSTRRPTRSGRASATWSATRPPIEYPARTRRPAATPSTSSTQAGIVTGRTRAADPCPRRSGASAV